MDHTYRDLFPKQAARQDRMIDRMLTLRKRLKHVPLSEFTPHDLLALFRIMDNKSSDPTDEQLDQIEQKLDNIILAP